MQFGNRVFGRAEAVATVGGVDQNEGAMGPGAAHAGKQFVAPMHRLGLAVGVTLKRHAELVEHAGQLPALAIVEFALQAERQGIEQPRQAGVVGQRAEQRLGLGQTIGQIPQLLGAQIEQAIAREELTTAGLGDGMGDISTRAQTTRQFIGSVLGLPSVARFGVHHHIAR